jgi:hypothetical protein
MKNLLSEGLMANFQFVVLESSKSQQQKIFQKCYSKNVWGKSAGLAQNLSKLSKKARGL